RTSRTAAATSASPPIHTSGAFESPPPKKMAQKERAPAASQPARSPAAGTGGDASSARARKGLPPAGRVGARTRTGGRGRTGTVRRRTEGLRSQTVYIGITARTSRLERLGPCPARGLRRGREADDDDETPNPDDEAAARGRARRVRARRRRVTLGGPRPHRGHLSARQLAARWHR